MDIDYQWVSEGAVLAVMNEQALEVAAKGALALYLRLMKLELPEITEIVPGAGSVLIFVRHDLSDSGHFISRLRSFGPIEPVISGEKCRHHEIPVAYGGESGPDFDDVARQCRLSCDELVRLHSSVTYTVAFLGFSPGFPYMVGLPSLLQLPRLSKPRTSVPGGSIAIAGPFSGIYPQITPGGWRLLGRTEVSLFSPTSSPPALFAPGDSVRFVPV